ncbi:MAG TPA: hypothetical protein VE954_29380 [Oligoflexus sp.]|uniref:hypothetical protein n=1 Tax=Oligoflexus sp. TaxID=1971216 RepID=UPI002D50E4DD|nr:hypothetical protein [Oligoflexus sp.]HYX37236.1 hypothetical protein [Oligoflexus sp.]
MTIAVDRICAEGLTKIQDAIVMMDAKMASLTLDEPGLDTPQPPETRARMERAALALDEIREHVRQAYGERGPTPGWRWAVHTMVHDGSKHISNPVNDASKIHQRIHDPTSWTAVRISVDSI